jgi:predicted NACHT family NTPase
MDRIVRQISPLPPREEAERTRLFSSYSEEPNIVLLGDPGAGKSYTFREFARTSGGRLVTARAFLVTPPERSDDTLFIDGLDEHRAGRSDRDTVDDLVRQLFAVRPKKVRLSCRAADWLGDSDLAALRPYFESNGGPPVVLLLERLSAQEQRLVLIEQGMSESEASAFISEANTRGLSDFLENPQNLIMLLKVVGIGQWPATRRELFEMATSLFLQEFNAERARSGTGVYSVAELRSVGSAFLAARLISDIEAVSLSDQEGSVEIPSYRSFDIVDPLKLQAALGRRVFEAGAQNETVDYTHRTTAEYLGAAWLAEAVRNGLPLGRVQALMGVDGHPASELRGMHAWLPVHLPELANELIDADPYGVLTYGDAASLNRSSCARLIQALATLSQTDPWFRSGNWQASSIGGLARADMVGEFREVLRSPDAGFGVRSIVVEALALGAPLPAMKNDLAAVVVREQSPFGERLYALRALERLGPDGEAAIVTAYGALGQDETGISLRAEIIGKLYGKPFGPPEIIQLLKDTWTGSGRTTSHTLYSLAAEIPIADVPSVLDGIEPVRSHQNVDRRGAWDVAAFYELILTRAWESDDAFDPNRVLKWLEVRRSMRSVYSGDRAERLRAAIRARPGRLRAVVDSFLANLVVDDKSWLALSQFREMTLFEISPDDLLDDLVRHMAFAEKGSAKAAFLYEAALGLCYQATEPVAYARFEQLYAVAEMRAELVPTRAKATLCPIPSGYFPRMVGGADGDDDAEKERLRQAFRAEIDDIRAGRNLGRLGWAAMIYFGLFNDVDETATPRGRLFALLGEANTQAAIDGFKAVLTRQDLPSFDDILSLAQQNQRRNWWYAIVAGLDERWADEPSLIDIAPDLLRAMLAFDLTDPIPYTKANRTGWVTHPWKQAVLEQRPDLARDAYSAVARMRLNAGHDYVAGLHELLHEAALERFRAIVALEFLRDYPNAPEYRLRDLLDAAMKDDGLDADLLGLARRVLAGSTRVDETRRDIWLAAGFVLSPAEYESAVEARAQAKPGLVFELRSRTGFSRDAEGVRTELLLPQLEFLARLTGTLFPAAGYPLNGWSGDTNPWDASDYFRALSAAISALPSSAATGALEDLARDPALISYQASVLHDLANQRQRRRAAEYDRPNWAKTVKALSNGPPATVADLHALLLTHLKDEAQRIARTNTDIYKAFWNLNRHAQPTTPRPEEACRDTLVDRLRTRLAPLGISVEPEGHMVGDRRADISVAMPSRKILCELKRDYHPDVWSAAELQLDRFYAHDPDAGGFGIYVVFWFGEKRPSRIPAPPGGRARPNSAKEMEAMILDLLPPEFRKRIAVVAIDVSGPPKAKPAQKKASGKNKKKGRSCRGMMPRKGNSTAIPKKAAKAVAEKKLRRRLPRKKGPRG